MVTVLVATPSTQIAEAVGAGSAVFRSTTRGATPFPGAANRTTVAVSGKNDAVPVPQLAPVPVRKRNCPAVAVVDCAATVVSPSRRSPVGAAMHCVSEAAMLSSEHVHVPRTCVGICAWRRGSRVTNSIARTMKNTAIAPQVQSNRRMRASVPPRVGGTIAPLVANLRLPTEAEVYAYAAQVPVATKDYGVQPIRPWGTQRVLLQKILAGKERGVNQFVIVKSRQVGASTFLLLLTKQWAERYPGMQGVTVTDSEENKQYFRDLFLGMIEDTKARTSADHRAELDDSGLRSRNQVQITWENRSRLLLQTAGPRTWRRLGVGRGLSFLHGTEVALWSQGGRALTYLRSAFSELNPAALYIFESTARGKNWYYDLWKTAQRAKTIAPIFLAWWMREDNVIARRPRSPLWRAYDRPRLSQQEREWDRLVRKREGVALTPQQFAWRRWYEVEKAGGNERIADQEMPTVWEDAFEASQERPFLDADTHERIAREAQPPQAEYVYRWGAMMEDTRVEPPPGGGPGMLRVWTPPDGRPVVVAAVPGHSTNADDPTWVVSVWAAFLDADRLEQVAEFCTDLNVGPQPFAWTALHLAGAYGTRQRTFILEVAGLGMAVLGEVRRLTTTGWGTTRTPGFLDVLGGIRHYLWRRPDS